MVVIKKKQRNLDFIDDSKLGASSLQKCLRGNVCVGREECSAALLQVRRLLLLQPRVWCWQHGSSSGGG